MGRWSRHSCGRRPRGSSTSDDLRNRLRGRLSAYKVPRRIVVVGDDEVPMMSSGKLDVRALKELLGAT